MPIRRSERRRRTRRLERVGIEKRVSIKAKIREHIKRTLGEEAARRFEQVYSRLLGSYAAAIRWLDRYWREMERKLRRLSYVKYPEDRLKILREVEQLAMKAREHTFVVRFYEALAELATQELIADEIIREITEVVDALSREIKYPLKSILEKWYISKQKWDFITPDNIEQFYFHILADRYDELLFVVELMPDAPLYKGETKYFTVVTVRPGEYDRVSLADGIRRAVRDAQRIGWEEALRMHLPDIYRRITNMLTAKGYSWDDLYDLKIKIKYR